MSSTSIHTTGYGTCPENKIETKGREKWIASKVEKIKYYIFQEDLIDETPTAVKVWLGDYQEVDGKMCKRYTFLPKSEVDVERGGKVVILNIPKWIAARIGII